MIGLGTYGPSNKGPQLAGGSGDGELIGPDGQDGGQDPGGKIAQHTMDKLGRWIPSRLTKQGMVDIEVSVCMQAYQELGLRVPREVGVVPVKANPDTGTQMCVGGPSLLDLLGPPVWGHEKQWSSQHFNYGWPMGR